MRSVLPAMVLLAAGCALTLPPPRSITSAESRERIEPVARLGRWDGERFVEVTPASIPPSHLRVLVHGWTPGGDRVAARAGVRTWERAIDPDAPVEAWMADLAQTFAARDPHSVVLAYSWLDDSSTRRVPFAERNALAHTAHHGELLAESIGAALAPGFHAGHGAVHLLGHSYGARVAAIAADHLRPRPIQLTLFDAPDAPLTHVSGSGTGLGEVLGTLPIGWGAGETFVDSYVSMVGRRYGHLEGLGQMVEVVLAPPYGAMAYRPRHLYPMAFYAASPGTGFGFDWSPLSRGLLPRGPRRRLGWSSRWSFGRQFGRQFGSLMPSEEGEIEGVEELLVVALGGAPL
jgi:hypothetical protein